MNKDQIIELMPERWDDSGLWFMQEAAKAVFDGRADYFSARHDRSVYLCRFWLCLAPPRAADGNLDSSNQAVVHWFVRGDDTRALHDHPWPFSTTILGGGYIEHQPPVEWAPGSLLGPDPQVRRIMRNVGDTIHHQATDLHCVGTLTGPAHGRPWWDRGTWTLMRTGKACRPWGFHPHGRLWVPHNRFKAEVRATERAQADAPVLQHASHTTSEA